MIKCNKPDFIVENLDNYKNENIKYLIFDTEEVLTEMNIQVHSWGKIDWSNKKSCSLDAYQEETIEPIRKFLRPHIKEQAIITWSEYHKCSIEVDVKFILNNLEDILYEDMDFWIIASDRTWVIEYYHEGELTLFPCSDNQNPQKSIYD